MIRAEQVTKVFRRGSTEVRALRGISCEIPSQSFAFLVGPSGSGKSTLLHLIGGLDEPTGGDIFVGDRCVSRLTRHERDAFRRHQIGFVFQNFNLLNNLDAVDNVLVPFLPQGTSRQKRDEAIDLLRHVGLGDRLDHRPNQLSGGEQQRVAIARAILKQPSLVLADEPTGELDSQNGAEIYRYLRQLRDEINATVIVVTHDLSFFKEGDVVLHMRDGKIVQPDTETVSPHR